MKYFNNFEKKNQNDILFDLLNDNIKVSFANAIRRTCMSNIDIPAIREEDVKINSNSSYLNNGIIENRISLLPIYGNHDYKDMSLSLSKTNNHEKKMTVYSSDIIFKKDGKELDKSKYMIYDDILVTHLKRNESLDFSAEVTYSNVYLDQSNYSPVSTITYSFKGDEKKIKEKLDGIDDELQKKDFEIRDAEREYLVNDNDEPSVYQFTLESVGQFTPEDLLNKVFDKLIEKLNDLKLFINNEKNSKISVSDADFNLKSFDFNILDEDDTLGNLISSYMVEDSRVVFCGYDIPHPLDNKLIIRTSLAKDNTMENNINIFKENIDILVKLLTDIKKEWETLY
jgi:DNA-directed RNA polymerase subunit L